ncbi:hypothetical protein [Aeromonas sp. 1HA1]|uniref:hypothetical protein n=1 Tax=Aeromonas sp. 1HA1 TaxID=2699193 RepID=UPI0023DDE03C|nr:hypothetical protein [Aeromonas sp. 1HA1]MDF2413551.1 hypothetical protein [Aeromonas sp. 1HA1]
MGWAVRQRVGNAARSDKEGAACDGVPDGVALVDDHGGEPGGQPVGHQLSAPTPWDGWLWSETGSVDLAAELDQYRPVLVMGRDHVFIRSCLFGWWLAIWHPIWIIGERSARVASARPYL